MPLDMSLAPSTFDFDARTVEAVIATTAPVARRDASGPFEEVLDLDTLDLDALAGLPVLDNHRRGSVRDTVGRVRAVRRDGDRLLAVLQLTAADDALPVLQRIADGTLSGVSIGYRVAAWRERRDGGRRIRRPAAWHLTEVTLTCDPADPNARLRAKMETMMDTDDTITLPDPATEERTRRSEIRTIARSAGLGSDWADVQIDTDASVTDARAAAFTAMQGRSRTTPVIRAVAPAPDDPATIVRRQSDAIAFRMAGGTLPDDARDYATLSALDLARDSLARSGQSVRGLSADETLYRAAHTTSDFPLVVSNATNKVALASYQAAESPLKALARQRSLPNFKPSTSIRVGETGRLEPLAEDGEITHTSRAEAGETMRLKTFARGLNVSRELLINDDMGLLGDMTAALGEAAAQTEADIMVGLLIDNPDLSDGMPVFDAVRGNDDATARTILEGLSLGRQAMRKRTGLDGRTIVSIAPRHIVVPVGLETVAEEAVATIQPTRAEDVNPFSGRLAVHVEPRLPEGTFYLFGDPARLAALQYAYLSAAQGVQIQRMEAWDTLGMKFRAFLDFGAGWLDWRAVHRQAA